MSKVQCQNYEISQPVLCNWVKCSQVVKSIKTPFIIWVFELSPNGKNIALAYHYQNMIQIYDVRLEIQLGTDLIGHEEQIQCLKYSPDGMFIASACISTIRIWDLQNHSQVRKISADYVEQLQYSPNGKQILGFRKDGDGVLSIWCCQTAFEICQITVEMDSATPRYSMNGECLIFSEIESICLWELRRSRFIKKLKGTNSNLSALQLSIKGYFVVSGDIDMVMRIWSLQRGKQIRKLHAGIDDLQLEIYESQIEISIAQNSVISRVEDEVRLWNLMTAKNRVINTRNCMLNQQVKLSLDARYICFINDNNCLSIHRLFKSRFQKIRQK